MKMKDIDKAKKLAADLEEARVTLTSAKSAPPDAEADVRVYFTGSGMYDGFEMTVPVQKVLPLLQWRADIVELELRRLGVEIDP